MFSILASKMKLFAVKFRRIFEVFALRGMWRKFWAYFLDFCVQKWSCFLRSSDAFWKFSPCEVYKNSSGRIITIYASKNEAVCREVQTHFGSFLRTSFIKRIWTHFLDFCVQKWNCLLLSSDAFSKFSPDKVYGEISGRIFTIYASKNEAVCREVHRHFGSFHLAIFPEEVLGALSRFMRPKMKLFAVEFRRIFEVFALRSLWRKF